jgi:hypothetical protein
MTRGTLLLESAALIRPRMTPAITRSTRVTPPIALHRWSGAIALREKLVKLNLNATEISLVNINQLAMDL